MEHNRYVITGGGLVKKKVKRFGKSGAYLYLPKEWIGKEVVVVEDGSVEKMTEIPLSDEWIKTVSPTMPKPKQVELNQKTGKYMLVDRRNKFNF